MSQKPISIVVNNKRLSMMSSMFLSTPSPFSESKENENFKLCSVNQNGIYLPPSPSETYRYEHWRDEDYFSFPAGYLDIPKRKHSTQAFARLEENNNKILTTKLPHKTIVESPKATVNEDNLILQLEDTTVPPMSPSCSTSTSEESDIDDLSHENSTVGYKPPTVMNKRLTRDFDFYVSEFIRNSDFNKKDSKKPASPSIFKNFF